MISTSGQMHPFGSSAFRRLALALAALLLATTAGLAQERAKIRKEIGQLSEQIEKKKAEIAKAEKALDKEKSSLERRHKDAFDLKKQKKVGAVLAQTLVGQCGPNKPNRKTPEAVFSEVEPDMKRGFGRAIVETARGTLIDELGSLMEAAEDPSETRCARVLSESFEAAFGKDFDVAWEKLKEKSKKAETLADLRKELKEIDRKKADLEAQLTSNIQGNHPRGMAPVPGGKARLGIEIDQIESLSKTEGVREEKASYLLWNSSTVEKTISDFLIDKYEVSQRAYWYFCRETGRDAPYYKVDDPKNPKKEMAVSIWPDGEIPAGWEKRPVFWVTWEDANAYCEWTGCRLPYEEEFEVAARSGRAGFDGRIWPFGNDYAKYRTNDAQNHDSKLRLGLVPPKGLNFPAVLDTGAMEEGSSPLGIFDLAGNVSEWTASNFTANETFKPGKHFGKVCDGSVFKEELRAIRGGHCDQAPLMANGVFRQGLHPDSKAKFVGFRRARSAVPGRDMLGRLMRNSRLDAKLQEFKLLKSDKERGSQFPRIDLADGRFAAVEKFEWNAEFGVPGRASGIVIANRLLNDKKSDLSSEKDLARLSKGEKDWRSEAVLLGMIHTDVPVAEPALEAGTWFVLYKAKFSVKEKGKKKRKIPESLIFVSRRPDVEPVWLRTTANNLNLNRSGATATRIERLKKDHLDLVFSHPLRGGRKSVEVLINLKFAPQVLDGYE
jgi:formylglycine-generating enzyme required for sulfatase activity/Skp family chaperone for outer membrane proteins